MTDRQNNMLSEMKRGITDALHLIDEAGNQNIDILRDNAEEIKEHYIGRLYQLSFLATIEAWYEKNG